MPGGHVRWGLTEIAILENVPDFQSDEFDPLA
jgi:hypothetical protein